MHKPQGIFIVLEGSDGSGKATQFDLLKKRLQSKGYSVEVFDFPRYDKPSSHFVTRYLNGEYGPASSISPYTASLFFALDRYEAGIEIQNALNEGKIVLSNRYVGSNMAHQGSKFNEDIEKRSFFVWEDSLEFQLLNIPRPNVNIFLRVPAEISFELIKQKAARNYTSKSHDEHEADIGHLTSAVQTYDLLCNLFPKDYVAIDCVEGDRLLDIESINSKVWTLVQAYLPEVDIEPSAAAIDADLVEVQNETAPITISSEGESIVWDIKELSLSTICEFVKAGIPISIDQSSSWGMTRNKNLYFIPGSLTSTQRRTYVDYYSSLLDLYNKFSSRLFQELKNKNKITATRLHNELMQRCLPMAALLRTKISLDQENIEDILNLIRHSGSEELVMLEQPLIKLIKGAWPKWNYVEISKEADNTPQHLSQIIQQLAIDKLPQIFSSEHSTKLIEARPRNEFDLLADSVYSFSDLTREEILAAMDNWDYSQKTKVFENALKIRESIFEVPVYKIDSTSDQITIIELMNRIGSHKFQLQQPTVRYGYDVPLEIDNPHLEEDYLELFDSFVPLYNDMQHTQDNNLLKYCTLAGHKLRWQANLTGLDLKNNYRDSGSMYMKNITNQLIDVVAQTHPLLAVQLKVNDAKPHPKVIKNTQKKSRNRRRRT